MNNNRKSGSTEEATKVSHQDEDEQTRKRKDCLKGDFLKWKAFSQRIAMILKPPSPKISVFVSSTFTDTQIERHFIMDVLLFKLREIAKQHGNEKCNI
jgi:hypothetical protein